MRKRKPRQEPTRCKCEGGPHRAAQHAKPGAKAADHGNPFERVPACVHSELQHTTRPPTRKQTAHRLRLQ